MRITSLFPVFLLAALGAPGVSADDPGTAPLGSEAKKAAAIRALLHDAPPTEIVAFPHEDGVNVHKPPEWVAWCEQFLADFREQRGIGYVEPVATSQRYDDPVFRPWQDRCPTLAFNARAWFHPPLDLPGPRGDWIDALPPHMPDGSRMTDLQFGTRDFKLFKGDYDNDPNDDGAKEVIFFADAYYSYWELLARDERLQLAYPPLDRNWNEVVPPGDVPETIERDMFGEYRLLFLGSCLSESLFRPESMSYSWRQTLEFRPRHLINGLIEYRGQYYVFDLHVGSLARPETYKAFELIAKAIHPTFPPERRFPRKIEGPPRCWFTPK